MSYITELTDDLIEGINYETSIKLKSYEQYLALNTEIFSLYELPPNFITITPEHMLEKLKKLFPIKPKSIYDLENGDNYYYINIYGKVKSSDGWETVRQDLLEIGNIFTSLDSAYDKLDKIKATEKVKKRIYELNDGWKPNWNDKDELKYYICSYNNKTITYAIVYYTKILDNCFYLKSQELVIQLINELEKELKIMLEVE